MPLSERIAMAEMQNSGSGTQYNNNNNSSGNIINNTTDSGYATFNINTPRSCIRSEGRPRRPPRSPSINGRGATPPPRSTARSRSRPFQDKEPHIEKCWASSTKHAGTVINSQAREASMNFRNGAKNFGVTNFNNTARVVLGNSQTIYVTRFYPRPRSATFDRRPSFSTSHVSSAAAGGYIGYAGATAVARRRSGSRSSLGGWSARPRSCGCDISQLRLPQLYNKSRYVGATERRRRSRSGQRDDYSMMWADDRNGFSMRPGRDRGRSICRNWDDESPALSRIEYFDRNPLWEARGRRPSPRPWRGYR